MIRVFDLISGVVQSGPCIRRLRLELTPMARVALLDVWIAAISDPVRPMAPWFGAGIHPRAARDSPCRLEVGYGGRRLTAIMRSCARSSWFLPGAVRASAAGSWSFCS
jgi:hypothetical protein